MAKTLVEQYTDIRGKIAEKEVIARREVVNIITDMKPILNDLDLLRTDLIPGEFTHQQISNIIIVMEAVKQSFVGGPQPAEEQPALEAPAE